MKTRTKTFDCVQMKRRGAQRVAKLLDGKTVKEQLKFWQRGTKELRKLQKSKKQ